MLRLKKEIMLAAIASQKSIIHDYQRRIRNATYGDRNSHEAQYDNKTRTFEAEVLSEASLLIEQLRQASTDLQELGKVEKLGHANSGKASFGKVVKTNKRTFFIAVGMDDFEVNGQMISGISLHSPVYKAIEGKKQGDRFIVDGTIYHILDVY
jgi:transcription elongation GreA/GreB family factor